MNQSTCYNILYPAKSVGKTKEVIDEWFGDCYYATHPTIVAQVKESDFGNKISVWVTNRTESTNIKVNRRFKELVGRMQAKEYLSYDERDEVTELYNNIIPAISEWFNQKKREIQAQTNFQVLFTLYTISVNDINYMIRFGPTAIGEGRWEWDLEAYNT